MPNVHSLFTAGADYTLLAAVWLLLIALAFFWMLRLAAVRSRADGKSEATVSPRMIGPEEQPAVIKEIMDVRVAMEAQGIQTYRGPLHEGADEAFRKLDQGVHGHVLPMLGEDEELGAAVTLVPRRLEGQPPEAPVRHWLHWMLFALTFVTTTWAGAVYQGVDVTRSPGAILAGLPYSVGLLLILGVHEFGHYFAARAHDIKVTPPFFIPFPFALGTFGAFIQMRSPTPTRRALFDVAIAGPLAGFVIAVPAVMIGLQSSQVIPASVAPEGGTLSSSLLFSMLSRFVLGDLSNRGYMIQLSPLAFAGWLGLLVTALNLLPIGQLDGGHIARAMFGSRTGERISAATMGGLLLLAVLVWPGLLLWALIIFLIAGRGVPPLNDLSPLAIRQLWLGYAAFAILALILVPMPSGL